MKAPHFAARYLCLAVFFMVVANVSFARFAVAQSPPSKRHALLVGCTVYPNLDERYHLNGPANDVVLTKKLLVERFQFDPANITILADHEGRDRYPTFANIQREWQRLASIADKDTQIFIMMGGHGSQTPGSRGETDGLDEIFLPRDVGTWNDTIGTVENAIRDDHLREWSSAINRKGAAMFVVIDACHSGTMSRATGDEVKRELTPEDLGVPASVLAQISESNESGGVVKRELFASVNDNTTETPVVWLYAAQSSEPTVEKRLPRRAGERKYFGLLSFTVNEILTQTQTSITYRDLAQQVNQKYKMWGRRSPTPMIEGDGLDHKILGVSTFQRPNTLISGDTENGWMINAGSLRAVTDGSVFAVYPAAGQANADQVIGHVKIPEGGTTPVASQVEPCEYDGKPAPSSLSEGMRCEPVYIDLGDHRLAIAVDKFTDQGEALETKDLQGLDLAEYVAEHKTLVRLAEDPADADWLLRFDSLEDRNVFLVPTGGLPESSEETLPPLFGPAPGSNFENEYDEWLTTSLEKIARVQNVLRIAESSSTQNPKIDLKIRRFKNRDDRTGVPVSWDYDGVHFYEGELIGYHIQNNSDDPRDVTVLALDSSYGVVSFFPETAGTNNRLEKGGEHRGKKSINTKTTGVEHILVISTASKSVDTPISFACLAQESIDRMRATEKAALDTPLGQILKTSIYGQGTARGLSSAEMGDIEMQLFSWNTVAGKRPDNEVVQLAKNDDTPIQPTPSDDPPSIAGSTRDSSPTPRDITEENRDQEKVAAKDALPAPQGSQSTQPLAICILIFGGFLICLQTSVVIYQNRAWDVWSVKVIGLSMVFVTGLLLVVAGQSESQIAPMMGLLGTIAGYLLGKK